MDNCNSPYGNDDYSTSIIDEDYLINLHNKLKETKKIRQQAEQDANLLDGKLRCLRDEEKKTRQKIMMLQKKESFRKKQKEEHDEKIRKKEMLNQQRQLHLLEKEQLNRLRRDINKEEIQLKKEEKRKQIEEDVQNFKVQRKANEEIKKFANLEDQNTKKSQADYIKHQHELALEKRRAHELDKKQKIKEELLKRIEEEKNKIMLAEYKRGTLEKEENDIIDKLNLTTKTHKELVNNFDKMQNKKTKMKK